MAAITSTGSGNWSSLTPNAPWPGGVVPTINDQVTIAAGHTVTLDTTGLECNTLTILGELSASTTANSSFTVGRDTADAMNITTGTTGKINIDLSTSPLINCTIFLNRGANTTGRGIILAGISSASSTFRGAVKKRWTRLNGGIIAGATSAVVDDASGWMVGDRIAFGTTQPYNVVPRNDEVILTGVTGNTISWTGGITYDHADNGYVGNFTSNFVIRPYNLNRSFWSVQAARPVNVQDVEFYELQGGAFSYSGVSINGGASGSILSNNAVYAPVLGSTYYLRFLNGIIIRQDNIIKVLASSYPITGQASTVKVGDWERLVVFGGYHGFTPIHGGERFIDCVAIGAQTSGIYTGIGYQSKAIRCSVIACRYALYIAAYLELEDCQIGTEFEASCERAFYFVGAGRVIDTGSFVQNNGIFVSDLTLTARPEYSGMDLFNRSSDVTVQESYFPHYEKKRNNTIKNRSLSSIGVKPTLVGINAEHAQKILCGPGKSIRVIGYVRIDSSFYNSGNYNAPTVVLSGLGETEQVFTSTGVVDTWEKYDLTITNNGVFGGEFQLLFRINAKAVVTGTVYFSGVPIYPFINAARHYGFVFDEANPVRVVNPIIVATESTALAYTGVTMDSVTPKITVAAGTADTFQKVYDYTQGWACENVDKDVLLTSTDGVNFNLPVTCKLDWPTIGNDGNLVGGWLLLSAGTYNVNLRNTKVDFQTGGEYTFNGVFSGPLDLVNSTASAVTVYLPAGVGYTTANNTGGTITVEVAPVALTITGLVPGSDVVVLLAGSSAVLSSVDANPGTSWAYTYDTIQNVDIGVIKPGYKVLYIRDYPLGNADASIPVAQSIDRSYA